MTEKHMCPRRHEMFGRAVTEQPEDTYKTGHGVIGQKRGCSYCGSMHPGDFIEAVRNGMQIGPTDKGYKLYVDVPLTEEQRDRARQERIGRYVGMGMTEADATDFVDRDPILGTGARIGKFYTKHLSEAQGWEFDDLWGADKVNWGYPGYPYVGLYVPGPSEALTNGTLDDIRASRAANRA